MGIEQNGTTTKSTDEKYCPDCGNAIKVKAEICPFCGIRQNAVPQEEENKPVNPRANRTFAIVLAFFLGGLGAHKFYMGRPVAGFVYLAFFWTAIPVIIAFVEMVMYLCMSDKEWQEKYFGSQA